MAFSGEILRLHSSRLPQLTEIIMSFTKHLGEREKLKLRISSHPRDKCSSTAVLDTVLIIRFLLLHNRSNKISLLLQPLLTFRWSVMARTITSADILQEVDKLAVRHSVNKCLDSPTLGIQSSLQCKMLGCAMRSLAFGQFFVVVSAVATQNPTSCLLRCDSDAVTKRVDYAWNSIINNVEPRRHIRRALLQFVNCCLRRVQESSRVIASQK